MEPNTSPLQDGTPAEPAPRADRSEAWAEVLAALEHHEPGISSWAPGERNRSVVDVIKAAIAGRSHPETEAEL